MAGLPAIVETVLMSSWLAVGVTDYAPVAIEASAFAGAVAQTMFGDLDTDKPWVILA